jgi:hypothetical protein
MAEAVRWGKRGARVNTISPGIVMTPLAQDELGGPRGAGYRRMIEGSVSGRAGTPDEVGTIGGLLMGQDGEFITGSDILMDGGVTAGYWYGDLFEVRTQQEASSRRLESTLAALRTRSAGFDAQAELADSADAWPGE